MVSAPPERNNDAATNRVPSWLPKSLSFNKSSHRLPRNQETWGDPAGEGKRQRHRKNRLGSEHHSRKRPTSYLVQPGTRKGLCGQGEELLGREGGAETIPQAGAASTRKALIPHHAARACNSTAGHSV